MYILSFECNVRKACRFYDNGIICISSKDVRVWTNHHLLVFSSAVKCSSSETCERLSLISFIMCLSQILKKTFQEYTIHFLSFSFSFFLYLFVAIKTKLYVPTWAWPNHPARPTGKFRWKPSFCRTMQELTDALLASYNGAGLPNWTAFLMIKKQNKWALKSSRFLFHYKSEILSDPTLFPLTFILLLLGKKGSKNAPNLAQCACDELQKNRIVGKKAGKWWWGRWS